MPLLARIKNTFCISTAGEPLARLRSEIELTSVPGPNLVQLHVAEFRIPKNISILTSRAWWLNS